ncbi:MAG TPA: DUF502 domain-containing protein [Chitinophagaceae bacterium]|jgi:uncharacterized membrane protein|nr:DUF502 domain-containing protein [Chitinophagaceae bacterium]
MRKGFFRYLPDEPFRFKKIFNYLLQGLLIIAPVAVTIYSIYWIVSTVDNWLPIFREPVKDATGTIIRYRVKNYGAGFGIILVSIILIGYLSSVFIRSRLFNLFDSWLEKTPGVKYIYSSVRDFFGAVAGEKKKFNQSVLANVFSDDVWIIGFVTDEEMHKFDMGAEMVAIYVPQAYNWAGQLYVLPRHKIRKIERISPGDSMKYAVTGGVVDTEEDEKK